MTNSDDDAGAGDAVRDLEVTDAEAGQRLDVVLVRHVEGMSRAEARRLAAEGKVRVNGRPARKGWAVTPGDRITLQELPSSSRFAADPDPDLALPLLHEDAHVVVVNKPAGAPTHPLREGERGTVAGALLSRYPEMGRVGYSPREPGVVHRLDNETSGLLLAARDEQSFARLREALRSGKLDKQYVALCAGRLGAPRSIELPLAKVPGDPRRVAACLRESDVARLGARPAETEVLDAEPVGSMTRVVVRARSARRHQIRAHLAALGHPLAGDSLYGGPPVAGLRRHFLHASALTFPHPVDGRAVHVEAPLPADLAAALDEVRAAG